MINTLSRGMGETEKRKRGKKLRNGETEIRGKGDNFLRFADSPIRRFFLFSRLPDSPLLRFIFFLLFTVFYGCTTPKGHTILAPIPPVSPEYSNAGQKIVFTNKDVKISILPLNSSETKKILTSKDANNPLAGTLAAPQYLAFLLEIENSSKAKLLYNPSLTTLFDNNMGIHKPLDYTDMYSLAENLPNSEFVLNKMKDMFYDLAVTLEPGKQTSRLLLFSGMGEEVSEVTISMKEIYIGTSTIAVSFGFKINEENEIKH